MPQRNQMFVLSIGGAASQRGHVVKKFLQYNNNFI